MNVHLMTLARSLVAFPFIASIVVSLAACGGSSPDGVATSEDELSTTYGDFFSTLEPADLDRWMSVRSALKTGFDRICGDTICGGDYSNLSTVRLTCSSTSAARKMKDCSWTLGGSIEYVDARTGKITTDARVFTCKIPVAGTAKKMLDVLSAAGDRALDAPLPGTNASFYDGLVSCFSGVMGGPPPATPDKVFYAEMGTWADENGAAFGLDETRWKLVSAFDDVCGDSFCEGDYPDITGLRFVCSMNVNTKRVARCSWSFALADSSVDKRGAIVTNATTKTCNIDVGAQASDLAAVLNGPDPLNAKLPNKTTSIYDALIGCL
jgi:hypothetical protein